MTVRLALTDTVAYGSTADMLCKSCADRTAYAAPVTRTEVAALGLAQIECDECGINLTNSLDSANL